MWIRPDETIFLQCSWMCWLSTHLCAHFLRNSTFAEKLRSRVWFSWLALASTENCENCKVVRSEKQSPERTLEAPLALIQHSVIKQEAPNWSFVQIAWMQNEIISTTAITMPWPWIPREFKVFQWRCLWYLAKPIVRYQEIDRNTTPQKAGLLYRLALAAIECWSNPSDGFWAWLTLLSYYWKRQRILWKS